MSRAREYVHRRRMGWPGTEPAEGRNPVNRYGAQVVMLGALLANAVSQFEVSAALALVALLLGLPRTWTWTNDRISSGLWVLAAIILLAGEVVWLLGGHAAREHYGAKGSAGAAGLIIGLAILIGMLGFYRRWGTQGNIWARQRGLRHGDRAAMANVRERAEREGLEQRRRDREL